MTKGRGDLPRECSSVLSTLKSGVELALKVYLTRPLMGIFQRFCQHRTIDRGYSKINFPARNFRRFFKGTFYSRFKYSIQNVPTRSRLNFLNVSARQN